MNICFASLEMIFAPALFIIFFVLFVLIYSGARQPTAADVLFIFGVTVIFWVMLYVARSWLLMIGIDVVSYIPFFGGACW